MSPRGFRAAPGWIAGPAAAGALLVLLPLVGVLLRVDWGNLWSLLAAPSSVTALVLSLRTAFASTLLCVVLGCPLALVLARSPARAVGLLRPLVLLPLVLPPVVGGIALLYTFGRMGLLGPPLRVLGIDIGFSTSAVVLAQTFVALPFLVVSLEGALRTVGTRYEQAAAGLGASPSRTLFRVTLPLTMPAVLSGAALSFARCLGEFGATLTFAGSLEGVTRTLPLEIYLQRETDPDQAVALSLLLVVVALLVVGLSAPSRRHRNAGFRAGLARWLRASGGPEERANATTRSRPPGHAGEEPGGTEPAEAASALPGPDGAADGRSGAERRRGGTAPDEPASKSDTARQPRTPSRGDVALDVAVTLAERRVAGAFTVPAGSTVALLGPNGVGKSTVFALIAGLLTPDGGRVRVRGRDVVAAANGSRATWTPAHRRGVALMAQQPLLFPHLSVLDNVAFGPRCTGSGRAEARRRARHWLREVGAERFGQRRPDELSGGQAQRVAIARVLAAAPDVVLLDEPLSALDVTARPELRRVLRRVLAGRTAVIITHDPRDVAELADHVVRMDPEDAPVPV